MEKKLKFLGTENNLEVFNFEYAGNKYQMTLPYEELDWKNLIERQSSGLQVWGDKLEEAIQEMEAKNINSTEFFFYLSSDDRIQKRYEKKNEQDPSPPDMRFISPFSEEEPILITYKIPPKPEYQKLGKYSLRVRGIVRKVDKRLDNVNTPARI